MTPLNLVKRHILLGSIGHFKDMPLNNDTDVDNAWTKYTAYQMYADEDIESFYLNVSDAKDVTNTDKVTSIRRVQKVLNCGTVIIYEMDLKKSWPTCKQILKRLTEAEVVS